MARPVGYDRGQVIEQAMQLFWQDGFGDCDVDTLTRTTGLNRHSLYKSFGGKAGLFHDALRHYVAHVSAPYLALIEQGETLDDLIGYFRLLCGPEGEGSDHGNNGYDRRGCLIANTVTELGRTDAEANAIIDAYFNRFADTLAGLVKRAQAGGSIRPELDPQAMGHWLLLTCLGLNIAARRHDAALHLPDIVRETLMAPKPQQ